MGVNAISLYRKNTRTVLCTVSGLADLDGYTCTLTVKEHRDDTDAVLTKASSDVTGLVITFSLTDDNMDIASGTYYYDIVIDDGTNRYTVVQDFLKILKAVSN